jgi:lysophospholipase L1-like esterase
MLRLIIFIFIGEVFFLSSSSLEAAATILPNDPRIQYSGRIDFSNPQTPLFDWPGVSINSRFQGTSIGFLIQGGQNNFDVQVDDDPVTVWAAQPSQNLYSLKGLSSGVHTIRVVKRTEALWGAASFQGLVLEKESDLLEPSPAPKRKIEIVGDSWVCGYGNESAHLVCNDLRPYENADKSFGAQLARDLNAEYHLEAYSGKGVVRNWGEKSTISPNPFPPLFDRLLEEDPQSRWDFSRWIPDAVIVHLGLNDFSTQPQADPENFTLQYALFLQHLRQVYPKAALFCFATTGWPNFDSYVEQAVQQRHQAGDAVVYFVGYPNVPVEELGCDYHPRVSAHRKLADILAPVLRKTLGWR